ncbi:MAG: lamin tail domain-containing protein [Bacteroidota bacterium]|nr:lamin tail domain-containing protein [Bacteroidota bacterium]
MGRVIVIFFKYWLGNKLVFLFLLMIYSNFKAQVFINEIMVNPSGANDGANMPNTAEWIEFYNGSGSPVNIGCWFFSDGDFAVTFPLGATIPAGGFYTVASAAGSGLSPNLNWATCGCTTNNPGSNGSLSGNQVGIFTNGSEQILLYNNSGVIQDAIIWGGGQLTTALTLTISAVGSCGSQTVTIPSAAASYENIGSHSDGVVKERNNDGSLTWQNSATSTFGASNGGVVMPVELLSFIAVLRKEQVEISWSTSAETNSNYFMLEYSINGESFFELKRVEAMGNSNTVVNYKVIDSFSETRRYYRLKQVDYNGNHTYSGILPVENNLESIDFVVFPNPTESGELTIKVEDSQETKFEVYNALGKLVVQGIISSTTYLLNLSSTNKGVYVIRLINDKGILFKKIIYE